MVNIGAIPWRAMVLPSCVALAAILALAWFNLVRIPAQEQYLNERNLRLLRTMSAQITSKVDNFDGAIDNALDSLQAGDPTTRESFGAFVKIFAPEIEVLHFTRKGDRPSDDSTVENLVFDRANDPPCIRVQRDEGQNYLYFGYKHKGAKVVARASLETVVADYLPAENEFDALLLVGRDGRVIFQPPSAGLELASVDRLTPDSSGAPAAAVQRSSANRSDFANVFEEHRGSSTVTRVLIGDASYQLYIQPVQLSLPSATADAAVPDAPHRSAGSDVRASATPLDAAHLSQLDAPEAWALCGLVRADHFRAASRSISYTSMLWFGAALAAICVAIPLLKLHMLNPRERLRRADGVLVAATSFLAAALLTFAVLDGYQFGYAFPKLTDRRLRQVAEQIRDRLHDEATAVDRQMQELEQPGVWKTDLKYDNGHDQDNLDLDGYRRILIGGGAAPPKIGLHDGKPECTPKWACRDGVLANVPPPRLARMTYPYFEMNIWNDQAGEQRIKWTTSGGVTPLLNLNSAGVAYFQDMKRARLLAGAAHPAPANGVSVFLSPNSGKRVTVFWKTLPPTEITDGGAGSDLIGQSLLANPIALDQPVLRGSLQFAVLDSKGAVLFHSNPTRSLKENFIQESEDSLLLKSTILERRAASLTAFYRGRSHRLYVQPLTLGPFASPGWSLIVFEDTLVPETVNLYTLTLAASMFALYAIVLAAAWAVAFALSRTRATRWFWPEPGKGDRYHAVAIVNGLLALPAIAGIYFLPPAAAIVLTAVAAAAGLLASYTIVVRDGVPLAERPTWQRDFLWARTSLLLISAAVPALVCFHVAYDFETRLFNTREHMRMVMDQGAREARIQGQAPEAGLCRDLERGRQCENFAAFVDRRERDEQDWDARMMPFFDAGRPASPDRTAGTNRLDTFLRRVHLPINEVGVDLTAAASEAAIMGDAPSIWWLALIPPLLLALHALSRQVAQPQFALDLCARAQLNGIGNAERLPARLLLVGPPGSGKTARLRSTRAVRTFDVRTLAFVERRKQSSKVAKDRRVTPADTGGGALSWVDDRTPIGRDAIVGIDHLEYRLGDPHFREQILRFFEELLYRDERNVWVVSERDPLELLREAAAHAGAGSPASAGESGSSIDLERWSRVFQSFRKQVVGINPESIASRQDSLFTDPAMRAVSADVRQVIVAECALTPPLRALAQDVAARLAGDRTLTREDVLREIGDAAEPYYRALWSACSTEQKLALRQLAEEDVVNPRNHAVILSLVRSGLVVRTAVFRILNDTFKQFVLQAVPADTIAAWERQGIKTPWGSIRTALVTCAVAVGGFLILTEQQLVGTWIGVVPALVPTVVVPAMPTLLKLFASREPKTAEAAG
jgi:hypothetical protein